MSRPASATPSASSASTMSRIAPAAGTYERTATHWVTSLRSTATAVSSTQINLSWVDNDIAPNQANGYTIEQSFNGSTGWTAVGTASASYDYTGDANHTGSSDDATFEISKAATVTVVTCPLASVWLTSWSSVL